MWGVCLSGVLTASPPQPTTGPQERLRGGTLLSHSSKMTQLSKAELDSNLDTVVSDSASSTTELTKKDSLLSD